MTLRIELGPYNFKWKVGWGEQLETSGDLACPGDFPGGASGKEHTRQCRGRKRHGFDPRIWEIPWRKAWQLTQYSCLENPMDRGLCVANSWTRLALGHSN